MTRTCRPISRRTLTLEQLEGRLVPAALPDISSIQWMLGSPSRNVMLGTADTDYLSGRAGHDVLRGRAGNDVLVGGAGQDLLDGGAGIDTACYSGPLSRYAIWWTGKTAGQGTCFVLDRRTGQRDTLVRIERLQFKDLTICQPDQGNGPLVAIRMRQTDEDSDIPLPAPRLVYTTLRPGVGWMHRTSRMHVLRSLGPALLRGIDTTNTIGQVTHTEEGYIYSPNGQFDSLIAGQTVPDQITYLLPNGAGKVASVTVIVTVAGVNDLPVASDLTLSTSEDSAVTFGFQADDLDSDDSGRGASDPPGTGTLSYTVLAGPDSGSLINHNDGTFTFDPAGQFEHLAPGQTEQVSFTYQVIDSHGAVGTATVTVTVNGVNDPPTNFQLSNTVLAENLPAGTVVGTLSADDVDAGDAVSFQLEARPGWQNAFAIMDNQLVTTAPLDYETSLPGTGVPHGVSIIVSDSHGSSQTHHIAIEVEDVNEAPTNIVLSNNTLEENLPGGTVVGTLSVTDPDLGDSHTFSFPIQPGKPFRVEGNKLVTTGPLNYERLEGPLYSVNITVTDAGGLSFTQSFTIHITDVSPQLMDDNLTIRENDGPTTFDLVGNDSVGVTVTSVSFDQSELTDEVMVSADGKGIVFTPRDRDYLDPVLPATIGGSTEVFTPTNHVVLTGTYTAVDANGEQATATITLTIKGQEDPTKANDDQLNTASTPIAFGTRTFTIPVADLLSNDFDLDQSHEITTLSLMSSPLDFDPKTTQLGAAVVLEDDQIVVTLPSDYPYSVDGPILDSFTYYIADHSKPAESVLVSMAVKSATVQFWVAPVPVIGAELLITENDRVFFEPSTVIFDPPPDLRVTDVQIVIGQGTVVQGPDGIFVYDPHAAYQHLSGDQTAEVFGLFTYDLGGQEVTRAFRLLIHAADHRDIQYETPPDAGDGGHGDVGQVGYYEITHIAQALSVVPIPPIDGPDGSDGADSHTTVNVGGVVAKELFLPDGPAAGDGGFAAPGRKGVDGLTHPLTGAPLPPIRGPHGGDGGDGGDASYTLAADPSMTAGLIIHGGDGGNAGVGRPKAADGEPGLPYTVDGEIRAEGGPGGVGGTGGKGGDASYTILGGGGNDLILGGRPGAGEYDPWGPRIIVHAIHHAIHNATDGELQLLLLSGQATYQIAGNGGNDTLVVGGSDLPTGPFFDPGLPGNPFHPHGSEFSIPTVDTHTDPLGNPIPEQLSGNFSRYIVDGGLGDDTIVVPGGIYIGLEIDGGPGTDMLQVNSRLDLSHTTLATEEYVLKSQTGSEVVVEDAIYYVEYFGRYGVELPVPERFRHIRMVDLLQNLEVLDIRGQELTLSAEGVALITDSRDTLYVRGDGASLITFAETGTWHAHTFDATGNVIDHPYNGRQYAWHTGDTVRGPDGLLYVRHQAQDVSTGDVLATLYVQQGVAVNPQSLLAASSGDSATAATSLTRHALDGIVSAAIDRWQEAGLGAAQIALLGGIDVQLADLTGATLALTVGDTIVIDRNAAGHGWFVDPTPMEDGEFTSPSGQGVSVEGMDLLSVVMHEMGHVLGLGDLDETASEDLMSGWLAAGERRLPTPAEVDIIFSQM